MEETGKRRFERIELGQIAAELSTPAEVRVIDAGQGGLALETTEPLEVGQEIRLRLTHRRQSLEAIVRVRWVRPVQPGGDAVAGQARYHAGVTFRRVLHKEATGLWDWIFEDEEEREEPEGASLSSPKR